MALFVELVLELQAGVVGLGKRDEFDNHQSLNARRHLYFSRRAVRDSQAALRSTP